MTCTEKTRHLNIDAIAKETTQMTKLHVALLGWDHKLVAPADYVDCARKLCEEYVNMPRKKEALEHSVQTKIKDRLPMLKPVQDDDIHFLCDSRLLEHVIVKYLDADIKISGAIEVGCVHDNIDIEANMNKCEECGASDDNDIRYRCLACSVVVCYTCYEHAREQLSRQRKQQV